MYFPKLGGGFYIGGLMGLFGGMVIGFFGGIIIWTIVYMIFG